jgi:hypothetical protein
VHYLVGTASACIQFHVTKAQRRKRGENNDTHPDSLRLLAAATKHNEKKRNIKSQQLLRYCVSPIVSWLSNRSRLNYYPTILYGLSITFINFLFLVRCSVHFFLFLLLRHRRLIVRWGRPGMRASERRMKNSCC